MSVDVAPQGTGSRPDDVVYPSRDRFRATRRQQRAERRRKYLAVPLVLVGLGMVGAGVYKFTHSDARVDVQTQVNGTEVTNTTTSADETTTTDDALSGESVPTIPPVDGSIDPSATVPIAPPATAPTTKPAVSIIPPATAKRRVVRRRAATTTTAAPGAAGATTAAPTTAAPTTTAKKATTTVKKPVTTTVRR